MTVLYSNLKFLQQTRHLEALRQGQVVAPVHVRIKPINHCNHSCWYCAYRADGLDLGEAMNLRDRIPEDKIFEIVDDLIAMGVQAVTFSGGGEPLLYKPLPQVVEMLGKSGVKVATLTNGSNLRGAMADAFARWGSWVRVSLDGWDDDSYGKARGLPSGNFSKLIQAMRDFVARRSACVLGVSFIVGQDNASHLVEVCRLLKDVGVNHVKLSGAVVANDLAANATYHRQIAPLVAAQIEEAKASLADDRFAILDHYHERDALFGKSYRQCAFLQFLTVIGADCAVYSCQDKAYTTAGLLGSIRDRSFRDFWFSEENRQRLFGLDPSVVCQHHCVTHGKNLAIQEFLNLDPDHACFV